MVLAIKLVIGGIGSCSGLKKVAVGHCEGIFLPDSSQCRIQRLDTRKRRRAGRKKGMLLATRGAKSVCGIVPGDLQLVLGNTETGAELFTSTSQKFSAAACSDQTRKPTLAQHRTPGTDGAELKIIECNDTSSVRPLELIQQGNYPKRLAAAGELVKGGAKTGVEVMSPAISGGDHDPQMQRKTWRSREERSYRPTPGARSPLPLRSSAAADWGFPGPAATAWANQARIGPHGGQEQAVVCCAALPRRHASIPACLSQLSR